MWRSDFLDWNGQRYQIEAKVFERPSIFGIRNGRVSKCEFVLDGEVLWAYDRGWIGDKAPKGLVDALMERFPCEEVEEVVTGGSVGSGVTTNTSFPTHSGVGGGGGWGNGGSGDVTGTVHVEKGGDLCD